ncbi:hypothetical protein KCH_36230 [Kitasatospora cheerisanensis KCTC 2395]|uniref:Uncharacterized protein n=1 Tax=Kitasatospora cheerisanensis KCTC 2395 TaxID=1348663 RepID=A0A066Z2G3_9ACTN|nr:hypothetical protein KCH_36230 [Kitasatospora cheerisanensis KCTC 2395]
MVRVRSDGASDAAARRGRRGGADTTVEDGAECVGRVSNPCG